MREKKDKRDKTSYDTRYRHKLNMLWPGQIMMKIVGLLLLLGGIAWLAGLRAIGAALLFLAGLVFAVLLILVAIELHQDRVLNELAAKEHKTGEETWKNG